MKVSANTSYVLQDTNEIVVVYAGDDVPAGATPYIPPPYTGPSPLANARAAKIAALIASRDVAVTADVTIDAVIYPADEKFKTYVSRMLNQTGRGKQLPAGDLIRAKDRSKPAVTAALLGRLEDALTAQEAAAWTKFNGLVDQVMAAPDVVAVEAIVW